MMGINKIIDMVMSEETISQSRASIVRRINELVDTIADSAEDIGFKVSAQTIDNISNHGIVSINLPGDNHIIVTIYNEDDVKVEVDIALAEALRIPNYYAFREANLSKREIAASGALAPAISATIMKLQDLWLQIRDYVTRN